MKRLLVTGLLVLAVMVPVTPAVADCPSPSGPVAPFQNPTTEPATVSFTGGGWGHAIGMSQAGAMRAAEMGCTWQQILAGYYPTTAIASTPGSADVHVGLLVSGESDVSFTTLANTGTQPITWTLGSATVHTQAVDQTIVVTASSGRLRITVGDATVWQQDSSGGGTLIAQLSASRVLQISSKNRSYNRGSLAIIAGDGPSDTIRQVVRLPDMDTYLWGLGEVPLSWPAQALRAQTVAARTYAHDNAEMRADCSCHLYDSVRHQAYVGADYELAYPTYFPRWIEAVDDTSQMVVTYAGELVSTYYSATNGGVSQRPSDAWGGGGNASYLPSQNTSAWDDIDSDDRHRWVQDRTPGEVAADFGMEVLRGIRVVERTSEGRALGVEVTGWDDDGRSVSDRVMGESLRSSSHLSLYSNNFDVTYTPSTTRRLAGGNRYQTAAAVSQTGWPTGSATVVIARGDDPADALGGTVLAGDRHAPLLLTATDSLPVATRDEVQRLDATRAIILGGTNAISGRVATQLRNLGVTVQRISGPNRFATMAAVANEVGVGSSRTAFVVQAGEDGAGDGWADALAISGVAARRATEGRPTPILGVGSGGVVAETRQAIAALDITNVIVIGGNRAVTPNQAAVLENLGVTVQRWSGTSRYGTSQEVAQREPGNGRDLVVVTGTNFPDGLAAGALTARIDATLVMVPDTFDRQTSPWLDHQLPGLFEELSANHDRTTAVGGVLAVSTRQYRVAAWYLTPGAGVDAAQDDAGPDEVPAPDLFGSGEVFPDEVAGLIGNGLLPNRLDQFRDSTTASDD